MDCQPAFACFSCRAWRHCVGWKRPFILGRFTANKLIEISNARHLPSDGRLVQMWWWMANYGRYRPSILTFPPIGKPIYRVKLGNGRCALLLSEAPTSPIRADDHLRQPLLLSPPPQLKIRAYKYDQQLRESGELSPQRQPLLVLTLV